MGKSTLFDCKVNFVPMQGGKCKGSQSPKNVGLQGIYIYRVPPLCTFNLQYVGNIHHTGWHLPDNLSILVEYSHIQTYRGRELPRRKPIIVGRKE